MEAEVEDWALVRDVRLRALDDAPYAFASRLEDERDQPESVWRDRLSSSTASTFLAVDHREAVGLVIVFLVPEERVRSRLVSMWVSPERRRTGVATALVQAVLDWAQQRQVQMSSCGSQKRTMLPVGCTSVADSWTQAPDNHSRPIGR